MLLVTVFVTIFDLVWSFFVTFFELNVTRCYLKLRLFLFFVTRVSLSISEATGAPSTTLFKQKKRILAKRERGAQIHPKSAELLHQAGRGGQNHLPTFAHCLPVFYDSMDDKESSTHTKSMDKYEKNGSISVSFRLFDRWNLLPMITSWSQMTSLWPQKYNISGSCHFRPKMIIFNNWYRCNHDNQTKISLSWKWVAYDG